MSDLMTLSLVLLGSLIGAAIVWYAMNQRTARLLESAAAERTASLAAAEAREVALNESHILARSQMQDAFTVAAGEAMRKVVAQAEEDKEKSFTAATSALSESMKDYVEALDKVEKAGIARDAALRTEVESVSKLGLSLADETRELSLALRGDSQAQGAWGEVVVENLLQSMGFVDGRDYQKQLSETAADRTRKRTDFVLNLPSNRQIVIDSKVSLTAYTEFVSTEDEDERNTALKGHIKSVRNHAQGLADKNYDHMESIHSLDFVLMVVPLESAYVAAMHGDAGLYEEITSNNRVKIVTGTTLMVTLKLIQELWKRENQTTNQLELIKRAGTLHDKIVGFLESFTTVGFEINQASEAYNKARGQLISGTGNVVRQTEQLADLGAKVKKQLRTKSGVRTLAEEADQSALLDGGASEIEEEA